VTNLTDGDDSTRWISTAESPATLTVDLDKPHNLDSVAINFAADTIASYSLQVSMDYVTWTELGTGTTNHQPSDVKEHSFTRGATKGRYVRIVAKDRWSEAEGNAIWEIRIYGQPAQ
jgi:hypothetical protein